MQDYKQNLKKICLFMLCELPIMAIFAVILKKLGASLALNIFINIVIALALYFVFEFIRVKINDKKEKKQKNQPKKHDPFAD